jgi:hypothetical protein
MSEAYRHHVAHAPAVVLIPYPVPVETPEAGSPKVGRIAKPRYPARPDRPEPWRPATRIPGRGKAAALQRLLERMARQEDDLCSILKPDAALFRTWRERGAEVALGQIGA